MASLDVGQKQASREELLRVWLEEKKRPKGNHSVQSRPTDSSSFVKHFGTPSPVCSHPTSANRSSSTSSASFQDKNSRIRIFSALEKGTVSSRLKQKTGNNLRPTTEKQWRSASSLSTQTPQSVHSLKSNLEIPLRHLSEIQTRQKKTMSAIKNHKLSNGYKFKCDSPKKRKDSPPKRKAKYTVSNDTNSEQGNTEDKFQVRTGDKLRRHEGQEIRICSSDNIFSPLSCSSASPAQSCSSRYQETSCIQAICETKKCNRNAGDATVDSNYCPPSNLENHRLTLDDEEQSSSFSDDKYLAISENSLRHENSLDDDEENFDWKAPDDLFYRCQAYSLGEASPETSEISAGTIQASTKDFTTKNSCNTNEVNCTENEKVNRVQGELDEAVKSDLHKESSPKYSPLRRQQRKDASSLFLPSPSPVGSCINLKELNYVGEEDAKLARNSENKDELGLPVTVSLAESSVLRNVSNRLDESKNVANNNTRKSIGHYLDGDQSTCISPVSIQDEKKQQRPANIRNTNEPHGYGAFQDDSAKEVENSVDLESPNWSSTQYWSAADDPVEAFRFHMGIPIEDETPDSSSLGVMRDLTTSDMPPPSNDHVGGCREKGDDFWQEMSSTGPDIARVSNKTVLAPIRELEDTSNASSLEAAVEEAGCVRCIAFISDLKWTINRLLIDKKQLEESVIVLKKRHEEKTTPLFHSVLHQVREIRQIAIPPKALILTFRIPHNTSA